MWLLENFKIIYVAHIFLSILVSRLFHLLSSFCLGIHFSCNLVMYLILTVCQQKSKYLVMILTPSFQDSALELFSWI